MKKIISAVCAFALSVCVLPQGIYAHENADSTEKVIEIHVSPKGADNNNGTPENPLKTLDGARKRVLKVKDPDKQIKVIFHDGEYRMTESTKFTRNDSGYEDNPIIYMAAEGEKPVFKGSVVLDGSKFTGITDKSIYNRIPEKAADKVAQLNLKSQGITSLTSIPRPSNYGSDIKDYHQLYLDGIAQTLSRWPNNGFATVGKIVNATGGVFTMNEPNAANWGTADAAMFAGFPAWDWAYDRTDIKSVDPQTRQITLNTAKIYDKRIKNSGMRYFVYNIIEELDEPGEWYIDQNTSMLYYYPMYPIENSKLEMTVLESAFVNLNEVSNLVFDGLEFMQGMFDAFTLSGCSNIKFTNSNYHDLGRSAVRNTYEYEGGKVSNYIEVSNSIIRNMGSVGVSLLGGDFETLEESGNLIRNNQFSRCGQIKRSYAGGVRVQSVGTVIEHNIFLDMPHQAIGVDGALNKVRYNEITDVCQESNDMGAIYSGRKAYWRGNEISYNYVHDITPAEGMAGLLCGVYWDDSLSGEIVHHNIFKNIPRAVFQNGGCDNLTYNNIVIDSQYGIQMGYGGSTLTPNQDIFIEAVELAARCPIYYEKFPDMKNIDVNFTRVHNNQITYNYMVNSYGSAVTDTDNTEYWGDNPARQNKSEGNVVEFDYSAFVDPENGNYEIKPDAEILTEIPELKLINMEDIGLEKDISKDVENDKFIKIYPKNGEKNVSSSEFYVKWQPAEHHTLYHVVIAEDAELKNVVFETETARNYAFFDGLLSGNKTYYWNVTAENMIITSGKSEKAAYGAVYSFQTPNRERLNQIVLTETLQNAEALFKTLSPGTAPGQCEQKYIDEFDVIISAAKELNKEKFGDQSTIDAITEKLKNATLSMPQHIRKGYAQLEDWFSSDKEWQFVGSDECGVKDNILHLATSSHAITNSLMKTYQIYKFKAKAENLNNMFVIALKIQGPGNPWTGYGYSLYLKKNLFELQRYNSGGGIIETKENTGVLKPGEWADIEVGALDVTGGVQIYMKVNDEEIFNYFDDTGMITKDGYLQFSTYGAGDTLDIALSDNLGEFDDSIVIGSEGEYKEPELFDKSKLTAENIVSDNGKVTSTAEGIALSGGTFSLNTELAGNEIFDFSAKFDLSSGSQGLGIRGKDENSEYRVIFDSEKIELRRISKDGTQPLAIFDNKYVKSGEFADIRILTCDSKDGTRVVLYVNSEKVFDCTDWYNKIKIGGLRFYDSNMKGMVIR